MLVHGFHIYGFYVILFVFSGFLGHTWGYLDEEDIAKRIEDGLFEQRLPWWLEKQTELLDPEVSYEAQPWDSRSGFTLEEEPFDARISQSMAIRSRREMELMQKTLDGEAVPYADLVETVNPNSATILKRVTRDASIYAATVPNGLRSQLHWKPIVIGTLCAFLGVLLVVGAAVFYQRARQPERQNEESDDEAGSAMQSGKSPQESLLGETTSLSLDGDRKLAHSAQMYHYQHQKQQMLAVERASDHAQGSEEGSGSDVEEGDFTVYECPGLAEPGQLHLDNPLYEGDRCDHPATNQGPFDEHSHGHEDPDDESENSTPTTKTVDH